MRIADRGCVIRTVDCLRLRYVWAITLQKTRYLYRSSILACQYDSHESSIDSDESPSFYGLNVELQASYRLIMPTTSVQKINLGIGRVSD